MTTTELLLSKYHGPGVVAELGSVGDRCWFRVEVSAGKCDVGNGMRLEILYQPTSHDGLPQGAACRLHQLVWSFEAASPGKRRCAEGWLPAGVTPANARQCYFRVTLITMDDPLETRE